LNPELVTEFLRQRLGSEIVAVERIHHGQWSRAFYVQTADRSYVARFSVLDEDFRKDQRVMAYASPDLPVARILQVGKAFDGFYAISERIDGDFVENLDAAGMRRLLPSLFRALDAMRNVDVSDTTGFGVWGGDGQAPHATWRAALLDTADDRATKRVHGWRPRLATSPDAERVFETAFDELVRRVDVCPNERYMVHSDLLYFNLLVADDRVSGVIDWGSSLYGDFVWDIAWFTFWQPWYPAWSGVDFGGAAREHFAATGLDVPNFDERLRCCELAIGLDGMVYQSWKERWSDLAATARRTRELLSGEGATRGLR
jgi:hygromycin-B 4-O-kinase